ncbi:MAG TPA: hypothetical protein VLM79_10720 [Kofleriaceae bacterium]|nr:hypothetical protein [Kofleriaceae bacterium]
MAEKAAPGVVRTPAWARTIEAVPPSLRYRLADVLGLIPASGAALEGVARARFEKLVADGEAWFGAEPRLAELGYWMIEDGHALELRRAGCRWLAQFPTGETMKRLARLALEPGTPPPVREDAIRTLGARQVRGLHPVTQWSAEAVQLADEALVRIAGDATVRGKVASEQLPHALRHVATEGAAAVFARAPGLWGDAIECFASPPLARVLAVSIEDIPPQHRQRVLRLVAATLGEEAVPVLLARVPRAAIGEQLEMLFMAVAVGGEVHLGKLEDVLRGMKFIDLLRARARWHLQNRGVVPTVRGLRVARMTATLSAAERARRCPQAADDLGVLTRYERHAEAYLYTLWGWMVRGAGDPARARELVAAHPESQELVRDLYLEDLARRGRVKQLTAAAQTLRGAELGALQLAIWGRPLAALELAATARHHTPELVCARALACYRAGRPDLTERIVVEDLPPSEVTDDESLKPFPGPDEQWMIAHAAAARPAIGALAGGRNAIVGLAQPAPHDAEPDTASIEPLGAVARRLGRGLPGATVYLAGEFKHIKRDKVVAAIEAAGARLVAGPFPGTDYYVHGDWCLVQTIAQLERQGARRLRELEEVGRA